MTQLFQFATAVRRDPAIEVWMHEQDGELGAIARRWFEVMRDCGDDVREVLHDGYPTACVADAAFAYVGVFQAHVNVGFFRGAELADHEGLLEGTGKFMRHVKLRPSKTMGQAPRSKPYRSNDASAARSQSHFLNVNDEALKNLIKIAYTDMKNRL